MSIQKKDQKMNEEEKFPGEDSGIEFFGAAITPSAQRVMKDETARIKRQLVKKVVETRTEAEYAKARRERKNK